MIYNFVAFLRGIYTDVRFFINEVRINANQTLPERYAVIIETTGQDRPCIEEQTFQVKVHDVDTMRAKILSEEIYYTMINNDQWKARFHLTLPETNVIYNNQTITYPAITIHSIQAIQKPYYLGLDENSRGLYTFNLIFRR
jgi:hypothetical protein